jgi:hypothetical protein
MEQYNCNWGMQSNVVLRAARDSIPNADWLLFFCRTIHFALVFNRDIMGNLEGHLDEDYVGDLVGTLDGDIVVDFVVWMILLGFWKAT